MPELPEVENTRRCLVEAGLPGLSFTGVHVAWPKAVQRPAQEEFAAGVAGRRVEDVRRRGKYLLLPLDAGPFLIAHLGMTGGLRVYPQDHPRQATLRHVFPLDDGRELRFIDGRKFGKLWLVDDPVEVVGHLGLEPLEEGFTPRALSTVLEGRTAPVKALLLEQSVVAGLGNLYADEALFLSGIHPSAPAARLSPAEIERLAGGISQALAAATVSYDRSRQEHWPDPPFGLTAWTLPRKSGDPCPRCGGPIEGIRVRGRGTYFCGCCQPVPRAIASSAERHLR